MQKILYAFLSTILLFSLANAEEEFLTPMDFGYVLTAHGHVDLSYHPPGAVMGNFNRDDYPDIARISGLALEVYINFNGRYEKQPTYSKNYDKPATAIRCEGEIWHDYWDIVVTLADGSEDRIENRMGDL